MVALKSALDELFPSGTCHVIAEYGQTCRGDIDTAIRQAETAATAGARAYKTQLLTPDRIAHPNAAPYWPDHRTQRQAFTDNGNVAYRDWRHVVDACRDLGLAFVASPFDLEAVDVLAEIGVDAIKIASGDITFRQLIVAASDTGLPLILSTGASTGSEVVRAVEWCGRGWPENPPWDVMVLACSLQYPTPHDSAHLARIEALRELGCGPVGYSDHTEGTWAGFGAAMLGARVVEKHCTLDPDGPVPDDRFAASPFELRQVVVDCELGAAMRGSSLLGCHEGERAARDGARRGVYASRDIPAGEKVGWGDVAVLRPASRLEPWEAGTVIGSVSTGIREGDAL